MAEQNLHFQKPPILKKCLPADLQQKLTFVFRSLAEFNRSKSFSPLNPGAGRGKEEEERMKSP